MAHYSGFGKYPIPFASATSDEMRDVFRLIGLATEGAGQSRLQPLRSKLVESGYLFTILRPTSGRRPPASAYFDPDYTRAAFQTAPRLTDHPTRKAWLPHIIDHLRIFAAQPAARTLISASVVQYYNRIADATVCLPETEGLWLAAYGVANEAGPLALTGIRRPEVVIDPKDEYEDLANKGRLYVRASAITSKIQWTLPGIEYEHTRAAISEAFAATYNSHHFPRTNEAQSLFLAGRVTVAGAVDLPLRDLFSTPY